MHQEVISSAFKITTKFDINSSNLKVEEANTNGKNQSIGFLLGFFIIQASALDHSKPIL
jgi:hypothetical protein